MFAVSFGIAMAVDDLGIVLGVLGSTSATVQAYILPGVYYYQLFKKQINDITLHLAMLLGLMGAIILPVCLTVQFV